MCTRQTGHARPGHRANGPVSHPGPPLRPDRGLSCAALPTDPQLQLIPSSARLPVPLAHQGWRGRAGAAGAYRRFLPGNPSPLATCAALETQCPPVTVEPGPVPRHPDASAAHRRQPRGPWSAGSCEPGPPPLARWRDLSVHAVVRDRTGRAEKTARPTTATRRAHPARCGNQPHEPVKLFKNPGWASSHRARRNPARAASCPQLSTSCRSTELRREFIHSVHKLYTGSAQLPTGIRELTTSCPQRGPQAARAARASTEPGHNSGLNCGSRCGHLEHVGDARSAPVSCPRSVPSSIPRTPPTPPHASAAVRCQNRTCPHCPQDLLRLRSFSLFERRTEEK